MGLRSKLSNLSVAIFLLILEVISFWWNKLISVITGESNLDNLASKLDMAKDYEEYKRIGNELDRLKGNDIWKSNPINRHYDHQLIYQRLKYLNELANEQDDFIGLREFLRTGMLRNLGGMNDPKLYSYCYVGTKFLIEQYLETVENKLLLIFDADIPAQDKLDFFHDTRLAFGSTALILHGGATFALTHIGVVNALFNQGILPKVICGTQIGSLIAALVCIHTDEELPEFLTPEGINLKAFAQNKPQGTFLRKLTRFFKTGSLLDVKILERTVRSNTGDVTFEEAYKKTGRILNISVVSTRNNQVPQLLNYLTAPNVLIRSAAIASTATSGLYDQVNLLIKDESGNIVNWNEATIKWITSSTIDKETPLDRLAELFNVNHFIVSQASPYILPFMSRQLQLQDDSFPSRIRNLFISELLHRARQLYQLQLLPPILVAVVDQTFSGHVTLFPTVTIHDFKNLFSSPTPELVEYWRNKGDLSCFKVMELIRNRCQIEFFLDKCYQALKTSHPNHAPHADSMKQRASIKRTKSVH